MLKFQDRSFRHWRASIVAVAATTALSIGVSVAPAAGASTISDVTAPSPTPTPSAAPPTTATTPSNACATAPKAPWRLTAVRDAVDPTTVTISWAAVACATRYNVSVFSSGVDDVTVVNGSTTDYTLSGTSTAKTYRIQVSSRNDAGLGTSTQTYYLRPSVPAGVTGMRVTYSDVSAATLSWKAPANRQPVAYELLVTRVADQKVILEQQLDGSNVEAPLPGLDARGMFVIQLRAVNASGTGPKSRLVVGDENPNPVKSIAAIRDPGNPRQVIVSWLPSDNTMKGTVIGYEIGYGKHSANDRIFVKATDGTVTIPADQSTVVIVRVITDHGKSRWSKSIRVTIDGNRETVTTNPSVDMVEQDGVVTVAASQSVADSYRLMVRILPTGNNGGFTDTQYSQNGANVMSFRKVPEGSYLVTVEGAGKEVARRYLNIGKVGMMNAPDWVLRTGKSTITDQTIDMYDGSESRVFSTRTFPGQDVVLSTEAQLRSGQGYGIWLRASATDTQSPTGLTFQYDKGWNNSFVLRMWQDGKECAPIAHAPFPSGMPVNAMHKIVVASKGNTFFATIDGVRLLDVPDMATAMAGNGCGFKPPTGTAVGFRVWGGGTSAVFRNTTVL